MTLALLFIKLKLMSCLLSFILAFKYFWMCFYFLKIVNLLLRCFFFLKDKRDLK